MEIEVDYAYIANGAHATLEDSKSKTGILLQEWIVIYSNFSYALRE